MRRFYDALQNKNQAVFWREIVYFCWIAAGYIAIAILRYYLTQLLQLRWRAWITRYYLTRWMADHTFYRLELTRYGREEGTRYGKEDRHTPDNPDQRIQEDLQLFTDNTLGLSMGLLNALVTLVSFIGILWGLNFRQQRLEADFRHHLKRLRAYCSDSRPGCLPTRPPARSTPRRKKSSISCWQTACRHRAVPWCRLRTAPLLVLSTASAGHWCPSPKVSARYQVRISG